MHAFGVNSTADIFTSIVFASTLIKIKESRLSFNVLPPCNSHRYSCLFLTFLRNLKVQFWTLEMLRVSLVLRNAWLGIWKHVSQEKKGWISICTNSMESNSFNPEKKMPFMNTSVMGEILLKLFRICKQAELWRSLLNCLVRINKNYENHVNSEIYSPSLTMTNVRETYPAT